MELHQITGLTEAVFYKWVALSSGCADRPELRLIDNSNMVFDQETHSNAAGWFFEALPTPTTDTTSARELLSLIPLAESIEVPLCHSAMTCAQPSYSNRLYTVEMKNLIYGSQQPCVMDLKLGVRMYGDDASEEKRQRMILKALVSFNDTIPNCCRWW